MIQALPVTPALRFHLSLNVSDLHKAVAFYRTLFGTEPAKLRADYAKFELDDPPLVLSLEPTPRATGGPLNHLGFRLPDPATLVAMQERLERAGIRSRREEGVECCYARQTKFWVHDPDGTLWEMYTFEEDIDHRGAGQAPEAVRPPQSAPAAARVVWEHRLGEPVPETAPFADSSAEEVSLRGSLNLPLSGAARRRLVAEAARVLRPGGRVFVHVLVAERPLAGPPELPGPAAKVQHVPLEAEPLRLLQEAGFANLRMLKFDANPCFVRDGVGMRELQLEGFKPGAPNGAATVEVLYKGPFRQVTDDADTVYRRGERVRVEKARAERLAEGAGAGQFVVFE
ncbi:MAG TPA: ArsI/CadI family heavy metal resistance metalloenzyme [Gemmataceae bacterium]